VDIDEAKDAPAARLHIRHLKERSGTRSAQTRESSRGPARA
jgi:hypothetical protein